MAYLARKAQGLPINTIIIIALALIVLIVMVVILTGRVQIFGKSLGQCKGTCVPSGASCGPGAAPVPTPNCKDELPNNPVIADGVCCLPVM